MVKRVLREAARHAAARLNAAAAYVPVDVLLRLKASLPEPPVLGWSPLKAQLRQEADSLLDQLHARLGAELRAVPAPAPAAVAAQAPLSLAQSRPALAASTRGPAAPDSEA